MSEYRKTEVNELFYVAPVHAEPVTEPEHYLYSSAHMAHHLNLEVL